MARRVRLFDYRNSRGPQSVGLCQSDLPNCAQYLNAADMRLTLAREAGDAGWWGTWARMRFNVDPEDPYITTDRYVARIEKLTICSRAVPIQNGFYEFLDFGNGTLPNICNNIDCDILQVYDRQTVPTFLDLEGTDKIVRVRRTDSNDSLKRVLIQGEDANGEPIYTLDGINQTTGVYLALGDTFVDTPMVISKITGIQKDATYGRVKFYEVDSITGEERLILTMEPSEEVGNYRRYYLNRLPSTCCDPTEATVQVEAIVKLDLVPVSVDSDYTLIQNLEALIAECESIRYSTMDSPGAKQMSRERHNFAIGLLQGELKHRLGTEKPAISFKPFGSAALRRKRIGTLI